MYVTMINRVAIPVFTFVLISICCTCALKDWDILIFTQHWPATVCKEWKEKDVGHTCKLKLTNLWTTHGIWPTKLGIVGPQFCNNSLKFDPTQLKPIENDLLLFWPNVFNGTSEYSLWKHEWQKHGTCASTLNSLNTEVKYFSTGINWQKEYGMDSVLSRAGINPDTKGYSLKQFWDAVKGNLGKDIDIQCVQDVKDKQWYLMEIRICFNKSLELIDCDGIKVNKNEPNPMISNCPENMEIIYPKYGQNSSTNYDVKPNKYFCGTMLIELLKIIRWLHWLTF